MKNCVLAISAIVLLFSCKKEVINSGTMSNVSVDNAVEVINVVASLSYYFPQNYRYAISGSRKTIFADSVFANNATYFKGLKMAVRTYQPVGMVNFQLTINNQNIAATYFYAANDTITIVPDMPTRVGKRAWYAVKANISGSPLTTYSISWNQLLLTKTIGDSDFIPVENVNTTFGVTCSPTEFK